MPVNDSCGFFRSAFGHDPQPPSSAVFGLTSAGTFEAKVAIGATAAIRETFMWVRFLETSFPTPPKIENPRRKSMTSAIGSRVRGSDSRPLTRRRLCDAGTSNQIFLIDFGGAARI